MEAIREYLDNMFMNLPETPEVLRAKAELLQMMEDKYEEIMNEGGTEQEAVGTVISEFGNLEELAEELGIDMYMGKDAKEQTKKTAPGSNQTNPERNWGLTDAQEYTKYAHKHALFVALGVMFCIWSPYLSSILDGAQSGGAMTRIVAEAVGSSALFLFVAAAVALFCVASSMSKQYGKLARYRIIPDAEAQRFVDEKRDKDEQSRLIMRIVGIALCILSVLPSTALGFVEGPLARAAIDSSVLVIVGVAVFFLVFSCSLGNRYEAFDKAVENGYAGRGQAMPAGNYPPRRKKGMPLAVVLILIFAGFLILAVNIGLGVAYSINDSKDSKSVEKAAEYPVDGVEKVYVNVDAGNVYIEQGDVTNIQYKYTGSSSYVPDVTNKNGTFSVQEKGSGGHWGIHFNFGFLFTNSGKRSITITIPKNSNMEYTVDADAGNVEFSNVESSSKVTVDVDAGNVTTNNCLMSRSKFDVDAGNVNLNNSQIYNVDAEVDAGNFTCDSKIPLKYYDMEFDTDLGSVHENGRKLGGSHSAQASETYPNATNEKLRMNVNVDMGNIEVSDASGN